MTFSLLITLQVSFFLEPTKLGQAACGEYVKCRNACFAAPSGVCYQCPHDPFSTFDVRCSNATISGLNYGYYESGADVYIWPNRGFLNDTAAPCPSCACANVPNY